MRRWLIFAVAFLIPITAGAAIRFLSGPQDASPWRDRYFPNVSVVNQDGKRFNFYDDLVKVVHVGDLRWVGGVGDMGCRDAETHRTSAGFHIQLNIH